MKTKTTIAIAFIILLSASLVTAGILCFRQYGAAAEEEARIIRLQQELRKADAVTDDDAAVKAYKKLPPQVPEIQLRIVQRQWRMALELMQYLQRARGNVELQAEPAAYGARLKTLLDEMIERCGSTLADSPSLSPEVVWRLYNTSGSAKVMSALVMLETGQHMDKVQSVMRDALNDYKAAIDAVDKAGAPPAQRNVPRWNFEVLTGEGKVQKFEVSLSDMDKNRAIKENLETLIPEIGGYGPGEPVETIIKK